MPMPSANSHALRAPLGFLWSLLAALASGLGLGACAAPGSDIHLAPFYSRTNTADAGVETEILGGLWRRRDSAASGQMEQLTVGPVYSTTPADDGFVDHFVVPLGYQSKHDQTTRTVFYPLFVSGQSPQDDGSTTWKLAALPGILIKSNSQSGTLFGLFPFIGKFTNFLTFDHLLFVFWPLFIYAERDERISYHFLYPFIGWTTGGGEESFRIFPFWSHTKWEGRYDRKWWLWPFFHYQRNFLSSKNIETVRMFWPFYGITERGDYTAHTVLWPFFGYSHNPKTGTWALDLPWPLVRFERTENVHRTRLWPLYGYLKADGLEVTNFLWPIVHFRHEESVASERDSVYIVPIWQSWDQLDKKTGETTSFRKLWPLFKHKREGTHERSSFPALDPFWDNQLIDRHYSWMWKLWEWETDEGLRRDRSWLGLFKGEEGLGETRRSLSMLWSSRSYSEGDRAVHETSLLFGLLRWRVTEGDGFDILRPAFPGPGWPAHAPLATPGPEPAAPLRAGQD